MHWNLMIHSDKTWKIYADFLSFYGLLSVRRRPKVQNHIFADNLSTLKCKENYLSHKCTIYLHSILFWRKYVLLVSSKLSTYILAYWKMKIVGCILDFGMAERWNIWRGTLVSNRLCIPISGREGGATSSTGPVSNQNDTFFIRSTNAFSFYRFQNVLCRSKFFEPAQKFDCI